MTNSKTPPPEKFSVSTETNRSPEADTRSLHCTCTVPAVPEPPHVTFGRKATWTLSLSFLAANKFTYATEKI